MLNVVDLFAGPGGLSLGFEIVKNDKGEKVFNILRAVEKDPWACKTLRRNFPPNSVMESDIRDNKVKKLLEKECCGKTDIVVGGPPCQSFSTIGPRSGNSENRKEKNKYDGLYEHFLDVVERIKPKFVVFENVKGILSKQNGDDKVINLITSELLKMGYSMKNNNNDIKENYVIINAADYGVPQTRERVFIIANNIGLPNPFPAPSHYNPFVHSLKKLDESLLPYVTIFDAIGDLPKVRPKKTMTGISQERKEEIERYNKKTRNSSEERKYEKKWAERHIGRLGKPGKQFLDFVREDYVTPLTHHTPRPQMETDILLFKGMKQGMTAKDIIESGDPEISQLGKYIKYDMNSFTDKYKKLRWKKPSSTIFAHLQKDGNRFIHPDSSQGRTITPREAARLQSFPDSFYFEGPMTKKFQQIGNAVPPILAKAIANAIANAIFSRWNRNHDQRKSHGGEVHEY